MDGVKDPLDRLKVRKMRFLNLKPVGSSLFSSLATVSFTVGMRDNIWLVFTEDLLLHPPAYR